MRYGGSLCFLEFVLKFVYSDRLFRLTLFCYCMYDPRYVLVCMYFVHVPVLGDAVSVSKRGTAVCDGCCITHMHVYYRVLLYVGPCNSCSARTRACPAAVSYLRGTAVRDGCCIIHTCMIGRHCCTWAPHLL